MAISEMFYFVTDIAHQNNEKIYVVIGPNIIIDQVMHGATIYKGKQFVQFVTNFHLLRVKAW
jgi:hypothetical protein